MGPERVVSNPSGACFFALGSCSVLYTLPDRPNQVLKVPCPYDFYAQAFEIEKRIYHRLGKHSNLLNVVDVNQYGIYLERASHGSIREYYRNGGDATLPEKVVWVTQVLHYLHQKNIHHADLPGRNILLGSERQILLCNFTDSAIDDERATIVEEHGFRQPDKQHYECPTIQAELHSLGSTIHEIVTGAKPYMGTMKQRP